MKEIAKRNTLLPKAPFARILSDAGAERVSQSAIDAFTEAIENHAEEICKKAIRVARHSGRKTVTDSDIRFAVK